MSDTLRYVLQNAMLLGAIQGIIFSGIPFLNKKYKSLGNFFLGMLLVTFSYNIIQNYLAVSNILSLNKIFNIVYIPLSSVFLVLYFLYVKYFLYPKHKIEQQDYFLFIPFLFVFTESVLEKLGFAIGIFNDTQHTLYFNYFRIIMEIFSVIYSFILIVCSYMLILKYEKTLSTITSKKEKIRLQWIKTITIILFCLCIYWPLPLYYEVNMKIATAEVYFYILWVGLAFTIYILGHIGIYQFGILQEQKKIRKYSTNQPIKIVSEEVGDAKNKNISEFENFIIQKKNYLDNNLSLDMVAEKLDLNKSYLSRIINIELEENFTDYVNKLRVEEAKSYMENPDFASYTLVAIGLEAGFNSKTTFNNAFKKVTGITPSEYRKNLHKKT